MPRFLGVYSDKSKAEPEAQDTVPPVRYMPRTHDLFILDLELVLSLI